MYDKTDNKLLFVFLLRKRFFCVNKNHFFLIEEVSMTSNEHDCLLIDNNHSNHQLVSIKFLQHDIVFLDQSIEG